MDSIKLILVNYAVCALLGSIFEFILPRKNKDVFRIVSSIILISVIIIPLSKLDLHDELQGLEYSLETEETANSIEYTAGLIEKEIYKNIENILINDGVNEYEIYISTKVDEATNEIVLTDVTVLVDENFKENISGLEKRLKTDFGEVLKIGVKNND